MYFRHSAPLLALLLALMLAPPAWAAVTPLWTQHGTSGGDLAGVVISADDQTILVGGDQLMSIDRDGRIRWSGSSGTHLAISSQGDYILSSQGPIIHLLSANGKLIWDQTLETTVTDVAMTPDASIIAAAGDGRIRTMTLAGDPIALNTTLVIHHMTMLPSPPQVLVTTSHDARILDLTLLTNWSDSAIEQDLIASAPDGSSFVTATNYRVRMYDAFRNLSWEKRFEGENILALAYSRDHSTVVLGTDHNRIHVLNRNGTVLFSGNATGQISSVAVSADGNTIVAGSLDQKVHVFNHAGTELGTYAARTAIRANSVAVTSDGQLIIVIDADSVYGIPRASFTAGAPPGVLETPATVSGTGTGEETTGPAPPAATVRKTPVKTLTVPTPYPTESETEESPLPALIAIPALLALLWCRASRR